MGAGPVEDAVIKSTETKGVMTPNADRGQAGLKEVPPPNPLGQEYFGAEVNKVQAPMTNEELIRAQHLYIEALSDYVHNRDLSRLASSQEAYILAQTRFIAHQLSSK